MAMESSLASRTVRLLPVTAPRRFATPSPRRSRRCRRSCGDRLPGTRAPRWPSTLSSASTPGSTSSSATRRALGSEGRTRTPTGSCGSTSRREPTCPGTPAVTSTPLRSRSTQGRARPSPGRLPPRPSTSFFYARPDTAALRRPLEPGAYTSLAFSQRFVDLEVDQSFGSTGDCYDNAAVESFFATLKRELAWIHATKNWPTRTALRSALFDYIEGFYNPERIQHRLGQRSPPQLRAKTQPHNNPCPRKRGKPRPGNAA